MQPLFYEEVISQTDLLEEGQKKHSSFNTVILSLRQKDKLGGVQGWAA